LYWLKNKAQNLSLDKNVDNIGGNVYNGRVSLRAIFWLNCNNMALNKGVLTFSFKLSLKAVFYLASVSYETLAREKGKKAP
jgi:hypothetical protein